MRPLSFSASFEPSPLISAPILSRSALMASALLLISADTDFGGQWDVKSFIEQPLLSVCTGGTFREPLDPPLALLSPEGGGLGGVGFGAGAAAALGSQCTEMEELETSRCL